MDSFGFGCLSLFELVLVVLVFFIVFFLWIVLGCVGFRLYKVAFVFHGCFVVVPERLSVRVRLFFVVSFFFKKCVHVYFLS